jgi:hypothetical protein
MPAPRSRSNWPGPRDPSMVWSRRAPPAPKMPVPAVEQQGDKAALRIAAVISAGAMAEEGQYVGETGLVSSFDEATNVKGLHGDKGVPGQSIKGDPGTDGDDGWTPITTGEQDVVRSLIFVDFVGGTGAKPAAGYIGPKGSTGLVGKAQAFNFNPSRSMKLMGTTNAQGEISFTLPEPMADPFICPVLYPSSGSARNVRLVDITKNAAGRTTGFKVRAETMVTATISLLNVLTASVNPLAGATVNVLVVDVS